MDNIFSGGFSNRNIFFHNAIIARNDREKLNQHKSAVLWFTGLSGSGKSTLAHAVEEKLYWRRARSFVLDGDNVRHGLCSDLGFSMPDRSENIRRIAEVAKLFAEAGIIVMTAFISPLKSDRERARSLFPHGDFFEIYCEASIDACEKRDVKGLYQRARKGEIQEFTGISSPYEAPDFPDLLVKTGEQSLDVCVEQVMAFLWRQGRIIKQ